MAVSLADLLIFYFSMWKCLFSFYAHKFNDLNSAAVNNLKFKTVPFFYFLLSITWPPDARNQLTGKDPDARKDWRWEEKSTREDAIVGWHHWLNGHEFEQAPGVGDGQGGLARCSPWGRKELDTTERLNWTEPFFTSRTFISLYSDQVKNKPRYKASYFSTENNILNPFLNTT